MNKLLYNQSIIAVNRKTQNTYMIIIQYDTDYYILNHSPVSYTHLTLPTIA